MKTEQLHELLENPEFFGENLVSAHSDHFFYESEEEALNGDNMPLKQSLNGTWKFRYSKNLWERPKDFYLEDYDVSDFDDIKVPGHIELQGYDTIQYLNVSYPWDGSEELFPPHIPKDKAPVGSYVRFFTVDKNLENKPLFISFQGVETAFRVFVNGQYVGYSEDSFTPAEFEITKFVHEGNNRLAVEVYKRSSATWIEDQDMWRFSGIFREVFLYAIPKLHVEDVCVKATLDEKYEAGVLRISAKIQGTPKLITAELHKTTGECIYRYSMLLYGDRAELTVKGIKDIKPWSAEDPNLYDVRIILKDESGEVVECAVVRTGFRTFELKNKVMLINGKRILFKGVDRHEFSAEHGRAATYEEMLWDIKTFKKNNINAVRTSHYPNQSIWYRLCDEYGIYMIDETNMESHGTWCCREYIEKDMPVPGSHPEWKEAVVARCEHMMMRDRNHPAIVMWSLGNEAFGGTNFLAMHDFLREHDDTRIVHYEGIVHDRKNERASDVESRMYEKPEGIRRYLSNNPSKPYVSCEYMHAMGNSLGGMKLYTDLEDEFEMYQGGFIWDYLDQALWQDHKGTRRLAYGGDFGDRPADYCFCTDGIVFANRRESPKCREVKNLYANVHLSAKASEFSVENRNLFITLGRYNFIYSVTENGEEIFSKTFSDIDTKSGKKETVKVDFDVKLNPKCDYVFRVCMCEKEATKWANAGYMVAFGESVKLASVNPVIAKTDDAKATFTHVANGLGNAGVVADDFSMIFSRGEGGPVSYKKSGCEYIISAPKPTYFRAYTDNDRGFRLGERSNLWHMLSLYQHADMVSFSREKDYTEAKYEYKAPGSGEVISTVTYKVFPDGRVDVNLKYNGKEDRPILPLVGWELKLDESYDNVEYFGKGPLENYRDKDNGAFTDVFETTVSENLTPYLIPQESGNRTAVRWAKVTNSEGHGLLFAALDSTFEFGFLPYSAYEIENATHRDELPVRNYSWIRIMAAQMGVGGDDSWGSPVQEMFRLDSSKDYELNFEIRII